MKRFALSAAILGILALGVNMTHAAELKVGDDAPEFTMKGSDGKEYKLSDFKGKQAVVIAWFPKAFTGGCTAECKSMKADGAAIKAFDVAYFTASTDTPEENTKFAKSLELDYPILSDPSKEAAKAYGVLNEMRGLANRWTFYIGKDGKITAIDKEVKTMTHGKDIASKLQDLGVTKR
jgi:thioredoxin-dependent peroxiredoxin